MPDRHRPLRLPEPGQQLAVLPVHLPRRARLRRSTINEEMKLAAVRGLAELAQAEPSEIVALAYGEPTPAFGPDYLIPRAFDPRLITNMAPAVAKAAMDSGVASRPIEDFDAYRERLGRFVYQSGTHDGAGVRGREARAEARRVRRRRGRARAARGAGRRRRRPRAARARRPRRRHRRHASRSSACGSRSATTATASTSSTTRATATSGSTTTSWRGARASRARRRWRRCAAGRRSSAPCWFGAATPTRCCAARAATTRDHLKYVRDVIGLRDGVKTLATMQMLILPGRQLFICDTHVNRDPDCGSRSPR